MLVANHVARGLVTVVALLSVLLPSVLDVQAVAPAAPSDSGGAIVPYTPPAGGLYQDSKPYIASFDPARTPRMVTPAPNRSGPAGFVEGVSKEMPLARKANTNVYANPDGTFTAKVFSGPVNWEAGPNDWRPIDTTVVTDSGGGFRNASGPLGVHFAPDSANGSLFDVTSGSNSVGFTAPQGTASSPAAVSGSTVRYASVAPYTDFEYHVGADRIKELIVLHRAPQSSDPVRFTFPIKLTGLTAVPQTGGSIGLYSGKTEAFEIPTGQMSDSKQDPHRGESVSAPVTFSLVQTPAGTAVTIAADSAWLRDPARQYPVFIDPTVVNVGGGGDSYVRDDYPN